MNWGLFMILITILVCIAIGLFGAYKIIKLVYQHKEKKYNKDIINLMERIYGVDKEKLLNLVDSIKPDPKQMKRSNTNG